MIVESVTKTDYGELLTVWEASVRQSHDFLSEPDIERLRPLVLQYYFDAVDLRCTKDRAGSIQGFCGVAGGNIEMLFIAPESMGCGIGTALVAYAIKHQGATKVDVNEQNPKALAFYKHVGFCVIGRSELDSQGQPFPLLHMALDQVDTFI
ncbi:GNAT family N-acetyltransferase [Shewanella eurypsychrophilus]|uniref:GNAT family N-acetyltransferase n=1 Tax=Shewanella eurypsychrophilus TaxID=2593656 RepID=A0ABX6VGA4_9GAMM|nr:MULTISPECIES: GNAT family N-acetyltransferase [Shewanella]QFU25276.1 GNAT family N-acetyltransferase [Shewanella sp. YLB-09]QPG60425.1 GNAT family N-acetyltransferase [Shewanella eurypsychrophilus]